VQDPARADLSPDREAIGERSSRAIRQVGGRAGRRAPRASAPPRGVTVLRIPACRRTMSLSRRPESLQFSTSVFMLLCMRTTVDLNDRLFRDAKRRAADQGTTLRQVIEDALRSYLGTSRPSAAYRLRWRTERGRVLPGVRLDDRDALFDLMDGRP
jgi:hypothetical protein